MINIDTPVTKKFFRKLELYLELKRQNNRAKKSLRGSMMWEMEKCFLLWAIKGHWHLGTPLTPQYIKDRLLENGFTDEQARLSRQIAQNLIFKKFAYYPEGQPDPDAIQLTDMGFLMGEVIEETISKKEYVYIFLNIFIWLTVVLGFLNVIRGIVGFFS